MDRERAETHLRLLAEAELRRVMKVPMGSNGLGYLVSALHAAGRLPPDSLVPGQLAGLCARLGIDGHGITVPPAGDLPERWHDMLTRLREPQAAAPGLLASTVAELPEMDGAKIAIAACITANADAAPSCTCWPPACPARAPYPANAPARRSTCLRARPQAGMD